MCMDGAFQVALVEKNPSANAGDAGSSLDSEDPLEEDTNSLQYSCLKNPMDQRSLAGYCPQGRKELDTTEVTQHTCTLMHRFEFLLNMPSINSARMTFIIIQALHAKNYIASFILQYPCTLLSSMPGKIQLNLQNKYACDGQKFTYSVPYHIMVKSYKTNNAVPKSNLFICHFTRVNLVFIVLCVAIRT